MRRFQSPLLIALVSAAICAPASAAVYKHIADDGSVFYSDKPMKQGDKEHKSEEKMMQIELKKPKKKAVQSKNRGYLNSGKDDELESKQIKPQPKSYQSININSPANDSSVRANDGNITLQVSLQPALQTDFQHHLEVIMDGTKTQQSTGGSVTFENVDRGTHQFSAQVKDSSGATLLSSSAITVHVQRQTVARSRKAR